MKAALFALVSVFAISAQADTYYCKLENVPAVKLAVSKALVDVEAAAYDAKPTGEVTQVALKAMGDAFDYWGTDLLVYRLDNMAKDNAISVAVKVQYNSIMAKEATADNPEGEGYTCSDTGEKNPEVIYVNGENANGEAIVATPVSL